MTARATGESTRSRILDTAWDLVHRRGINAVTIAGIAGATGVSRQLVYVHFANRAGLLVAMARHHDARSGFAARVAAAAALPPLEALERLLRDWLDYVPEILPVARALEAAAINGDEGGNAWHDRMADLHRAFRLAVQRVDDAGRLAAGWTVETAADWVWARGHLANWQHLVGERGWPPDRYVERTVRSVLDEVTVPEPARKGPRSRVGSRPGDRTGPAPTGGVEPGQGDRAGPAPVGGVEPGPGGRAGPAPGSRVGPGERAEVSGRRGSRRAPDRTPSGSRRAGGRGRAAR